MIRKIFLNFLCIYKENVYFYFIIKVLMIFFFLRMVYMGVLEYENEGENSF